MARTSPDLVKAVLGSDYGTGADGVTLPDLGPSIDAASLIVNRVATCAASKGRALTGLELEMVERWLAAHVYTTSDPMYASKGEGGASASYVRAKDKEPYLDRACFIDFSGCLTAIYKRQFASGFSITHAPGS